MNYKKIVSFSVEGDVLGFIANVLDNYDFTRFYETREIQAFETPEEASKSLISACTDYDYGDWSWSDASDVLKEMFFTMSREDAELAIEMAYDNAHKGYSREHVFSIIKSWYDDYAYEDMLKRVLYKALVDSNSEIMMSAAKTAMDLFPNEFRSTIEAIETKSEWIDRFIKKVLKEHE